MKVKLPKAGVYVVAVSGGVDSMVLLDLLYKTYKDKAGYRIIVAHMDHGTRSDSYLDRRLVEDKAKEYSFRSISKKVNLGKEASEDVARTARYNFLKEVANANQADYILTAHHEDDLIETAIINLLRGTGRKGLSAIINNRKVLRPLLNYPKKEILDYAKANQINWHEDSTNENETYLRNYIRKNLMPELKPSARHQLVELINKTADINVEADEIIDSLVSVNQDVLSRQLFIALPHDAAKEVLASWLRHNGIGAFKKSTLERLTVSAKIGTTGQIYPVQNRVNLKIYKDKLALE